MRIAITGKEGQVVASVLERGRGKAEIIMLGRPAFDLTNRDSVLRLIEGARPDVIINAAAYTAVDRAEQEPDLAMRVNGDGAGFVAEAAAALGAPLLHVSTDYVFGGTLERPYREQDPTGPTGVYGRSKLVGEQQVAMRCANSAILRTAWVYSPFGANFVRTMLRLGETRAEVSVVADQQGNPTAALDIADALLVIAERLYADPAPSLRGVFHMTGAGEASWADFAQAIFAEAEKHGRKAVMVKKIRTADYPTPAQRPANSRLDPTKLRRTFGLALPDWRTSVAHCVDRLIG